MLEGRDLVQLFAAAGHLALAILSLSRGGRSALARPLSLLCFDLFGWNFAVLAHHVTGAHAWGWIDSSLTALSPPLALDLVVTFVGAARARRFIVRSAYAGFGVLAVSSLSPFVSATARAWDESGGMTTIFLGIWLAAFAWGLALLVRHLVATADPVEKARTRTVLAAIVVGGALAMTDLLAELGWPVPRLASMGTLCGTSLVATAAFRFKLFDRDLSASTGVYAGALSVAGVGVYLAAYALLGGNVAGLLVGITAITLAMALAVREVLGSLARERERVARLAVLGRVSAQMAHDLKNPLAALLGSAQVLEGAAPGQPREAQSEFVKLIVEQAQRLRAIVDKYDRLGRAEPLATTVQLNDVVRRVVSAQRHAASGIEVRLELDDAIPECDADAELVTAALENLLRNAFEAMPHGGTVTVRTRRATDAPEGPSVVVTVEDTGEGMDARRAERAFDDFFTTKARGSGLGLAFVRRVAVAHGGDVSLESRIGEGTRVEVRIPERPR